MEQRTKELLKTCKMKVNVYKVKPKKAKEKLEPEVQAIPQPSGFQWEDFKKGENSPPSEFKKTLKSMDHSDSNFDIFHEEEK